MRNIGDEIWINVFEGISVLCIVLKTENGRASKVKAKFPDERLGKFGFFKNDCDDYVLFDLDILINHN